MKKEMKRFRGLLWMMTAFLMFCMIVSVGSEHVLAEEKDTFVLTYMLDGEEFLQQEYKEGDIVTAPEAPEKEFFVFKEWKDLPEVMPAEDLTVSGVYGFAGTLVTDLENVYECELVVSEEIAVTMYLRIDQEGNFVFSRSTDFSNPEKGAGKVYVKTPAGDLKAGAYAVDISWSPMADMIVPMLDIDTETMTFRLYGEADPAVSKGSGSVSLKEDVYTLHFDDSENTTDFRYEEGRITFESKLWYGSASFDRTEEDGTFLSYEAELTEEAKAAEMTGAEETDKYYMVYYVVNGEAVAEGANVSEFAVEEDGSITFLSEFWFGAVTPKFEGEDGTFTYPVFVVSDEKLLADIVKDTIVSKSEVAEKDKEENMETTDAVFRTGIYGGTHNTTAMGKPLVYACTISFHDDGTYFYTVQFHVMGSLHTESESGSYTVNGNSIVLRADNGTVMNGTIGNQSVTITREASSFAFAPASITFVYGVVPSPSISTEDADDSENNQKPEKPQDNENENNPTPEVNENGLVGGNYLVDISWSPMASWMKPVLSIDAKNMTFKLYNQGTSSESKGSGTITYADPLYTLCYSNGNKTEFTFQDGVITFLSKLWYGTASFDQKDEKGDFLTYTAVAEKTAIEENEDKKPEEEEQPEEPEKPEEEQPEEPEKPEEEESLKPGTYSGTYTKMAMGSEVVYQYSLIMKEDGTYSYSVKFSMMGNEYSETENGTYTSEGTDFVLMSEDGVEMAGKVNEDETLTVERKVSSFAASALSLQFAPGELIEGPETEQKPEDEKEPEDEQEPEDEKEPEGETEMEPEKDPNQLVSGAYAVDISWSPMGSMISPILSIDAENMTFSVYNAGKPETSKGSGTITYTDGIYTLHYENGNTTQFTSMNGVLTFKSKLWYGTASFDSSDENGEFSDYKGNSEKKEEENSEDENSEDENLAEENSISETVEETIEESPKEENAGKEDTEAEIAQNEEVENGNLESPEVTEDEQLSAE